MNAVSNGTDISIEPIQEGVLALPVPIDLDMTLPAFQKAARRAFLLWHMRDHPTIATLLKQLDISRTSLYREFGDLLTWEHVTFNFHPFIRSSFKSCPWLKGAVCENCWQPFEEKEFIFVQNVKTRHEIPVPAYHAGCLRRITARERLAARARHAAVRI